MAQKLFVNNTNYSLNIQIGVRLGSQPGQELTSVNFSPEPEAQNKITYGDDSDPYVDQLDISAETNGAVILSQQIVIERSSNPDNMFNMNDTIYIALFGQSFVITSANTWTVS